MHSQVTMRMLIKKNKNAPVVKEGKAKNGDAVIYNGIEGPNLFTMNYQVNSKISADQICRRHEQHFETTYHFLSGCPILTPKYKEKLAGMFIGRYAEIDNETLWENHSEPLIKDHKINILCIFSIHTDRQIEANRH